MEKGTAVKQIKELKPNELILLPALVALTVKCIPRDVWERCRKESEGMWADGRPKKWYYVLPVILTWALIIWLIVRAIL